MKINLLEKKSTFNRLKFIQIIKNRLNIDLKEAKSTVEKILKTGEYQFDFLDLEFLKVISGLGLNTHFSYYKGKELFVGSCINSNLIERKEKTEFSLSEIKECLEDIKNFVLFKDEDKSYAIFDISHKPPLYYLIESEFLHKQCVDYLLSKKVKVYKSIKDLG